MSLVTGQGTPGRQAFRMLVRLVVVLLIVLVMWLVTGQGTPGRQDFRRLFVIVERQGIGRMGLRGRIGNRLVQEERLRMLVRLMLVALLVTRRVLVRETGQVMDVQSMGQEPRPGLGETRADPPPPEPTESLTGDGGE